MVSTPHDETSPKKTPAPNSVEAAVEEIRLMFQTRDDQYMNLHKDLEKLFRMQQELLTTLSALLPKLKTMTMYFDVHESDNLQDCMEMKRFEDLKKMKREKDTGVKVEAMIADDQKFAAVQISEYIPYSYEAVTPVMCYYGEEARLLASYLKVS